MFLVQPSVELTMPQEEDTVVAFALCYHGEFVSKTEKETGLFVHCCKLVYIMALSSWKS